MPKYKGIQKKGKRWYWYIDYKTKRYWSRGFPSAQEAIQNRALAHSEIISGRYKANSKITLKDFIIYYAEEYGPNLRENTLSQIEAHSRLYIAPELGHIKLSNLKVIDIQRLQNKLLQEKKPHYVHNIMCVLRRILNQAVEWEFIVANPATKIPLPKYERKEYEILTPEQLSNLIDLAPLRDKAVIGLAGLAGLRLGEVFGLQWQDIDFMNNQVVLQRQYNKCQIKPLKTQTSRAPIPIYPQLALILKEWRLKCQFSKWLFPSREDRPLNPEAYTKTPYKALLKKCGLPHMRFHDLRHTFASILLSEGASLTDVQKLMRHARYNTTIEIYHHLLPNQLETTLNNSFDAAFRRRKRRKEENGNA